MKERCVQGVPTPHLCLECVIWERYWIHGRRKRIPGCLELSLAGCWSWFYLLDILVCIQLGSKPETSALIFGKKKINLFPKKVNGTWCWNSNPSTKVVGRLSSIGADGEILVELPFGDLPAAIPVKNTNYELLNSTFSQTRIPNFYFHLERKKKNSINVGLFERMELCHFQAFVAFQSLAICQSDIMRVDEESEELGGGLW